MKESPAPNSTSERVRRQYDAHPFPGRGHLSHEGLQLLSCLRRWLPANAEQNRASAPRVMDVGCGTGELLISLARHFPHVEFVGVDRAQVSLQLAEDAAKTQQISNIVFRSTDITTGLRHLGAFRVVISTGVLHHLPDLPSAFREVCALVEPQGHLVVWLYGKFGRFHHRLNQQFLQMLCATETDGERQKIARAFVKHLGKSAIGTGFHTPFGSGEKGLQWLHDNPAWLVDQMIPAYETNVTIREILDLLADNGMNSTHWLGVPTDLAAHTSSRLLVNRFRKLSPQDRMIALDYLLKPPYYFVTARKNRSGGMIS